MTPRRALRFLHPTATLALALLALSASAVPASAQTSVTLVSNTGQTLAGSQQFSAHDAAAQFTTGSNSFGYKLTGIDLGLGAVVASTATFRVVIGKVTPGCSQGGNTSSLTHPTPLVNGFNTFTAPGTGIDLAANTTYRVAVDVVAQGNGSGVAFRTGSDAEDSGAAAGWSIADDGCQRAWNTAGWSSTNVMLVFAIKGYAKTATATPARPGEPTVEKGPTSGSLKVSWTAPDSGMAKITDYDLRYFKGSMDPDSESKWVTEGPGASGLPHPDTAFTATADTITALLANSAYRVQVRAANANGEGPWSASGIQTTAMAPGTNNAPRVLETKTGDANNNCQVKTNTSTPAATVRAFGGTLHRFSPFVVRGSETTEWPTQCTVSNANERQVPVFDDRDAEQLLLTIDYTLPNNIVAFDNYPRVMQPDAQPGSGDNEESQGDIWFRGYAAFDTTDVRIDVTATDPHGASASTHVIFKVISDSSQRTPSLPAVGGRSYAVNEAIDPLILPTATGGDTIVHENVLLRSYFYTVSGLPPGLSFNKSTRTISGTPTTAGSYTVTYQAEDSDIKDANDGDLSDTAVQTFQILVEGNGPVIQSLGIVSFPSLDRSGDGTADTYGLGETIAVEVEFTEPVVVTGDNSAVRLRLDLGADNATLTDSRKVLNLHSHTGNTLRFEYTVASGDTDADGVWVQTASATNAKVVFLTGTATIKDADNNDAVLTKSGLPTSGDANQKVDQSLAPLPKFESAEVNGDKLTITFTGKLATANAPAASRFTLSGAFPRVSSVAFSADSTQVILTLNLRVLRDETEIKVSYAKGDDANPLQVPATWQLANFSNRPVRNVTPPKLLGAEVSGTVATVRFDSELNASKTPSPSRFTVSGPTETTTVTAVAVSSVDAREVNLTLSPRVGAADTASVAYEAGDDANPLQDANGVKVADFTEELGNVTPPVVTDASVNRKILTLAFDGRLYSGGRLVHSPPDVSRFTVSGTAAGATVTAVQIPDPSDLEPGENTEVQLTLSARVEIGETGITVSYTAGDDANPLRSTSRVNVADFTGRQVTNATQPPTAERLYVASSPSIDANSDNTAETYGLGEVVRAVVIFDEDVTVDASGGTPRLRIDLKSGSGGERWASYEGVGIEASQQVFGYTVTAADTSTAGFAVLENTLELNGGTIRSAVAAVTTNANLAHEGLAHDADHKVDGSLTSSAPVLWERGARRRAGTVNGSTVTLDFNKNLDALSSPAGSAFTARVIPIDNSQPRYTIDGTATASISGATVTVTLASAVPGDVTVEVSYAKPAANPLRGAGGGEVAAFSNKWVHNFTPSGLPIFPTTTSELSVRENSAAGTLVGTVTATDPNDDALTYTLTSTASGGTDHESFAIDANTGQITVAAGATLNFEAKPSYAVTVTASDGTLSADHLLTIRVTRAPSTTSPPSAPGAPTVTPASATSLTVTWSAPSDLGSATVIQDYDLRYYAGSADPANPSDWIEEGEANGPPDPGPSTSAVLSGLAENTAYVVQVRGQGDGESPWSPSGGATTRAPAAAPPTNGAVSADGATVTLEFAEALDPASVPAPGDFTVTLAPASFASSEASSGGPSASASTTSAQHRVTAVAIRGSALDLTVSPPVPAGRAAVVSYTKGSSPLRTASGAEVPDFGFTAAPPTASSQVTVAGGSATEGSAVTFTVRLTSAVSTNVVLGWSTGRDGRPGAVNATPDVDYTAVTGGRVTIPAGSLEATFAVATLTDSEAEDAETFAVTIDGAGLPGGVTVATASAVGTIVDDPPAPPPARPVAVSVEGGSALEGSAVKFTVRLSAAAASDVVLGWSTGPDDRPGARQARADVDYRPVSDGRVTVAAGATEATFEVATLADLDEEGDETFAVTVAGIGLPDGVTVATTSAVSTIVDDPQQPPPVRDTVSVEGGAAVEGEPVTFTARLSSPVRSDVVLRWFTTPDYARGASRAAGGADYTAVSDGRVRIAAGTTSGTFAVATVRDTLEEGEETFRVIITEIDLPEGAGIVHSTAVGTISDYTPPPNEAPSFESPEYAFELEENVDGSALSVRLGAVSATDPDGDELTYALAAGDSTRFAVGVRNGAVLYVGPGEDFEAEPNLYVLTVRASDPAGESAEAAVTVTVLNVNELPEAAGDAASTDEDVAVELDVLANDTDADGDSLRVSSVSVPENGTTAVSAAGGVLYTPDANWYGTDRFTYEVDDGNGGTAEASVEVTVAPVNDAPEAADDAASADEDVAVEIDVLANDTDIDGDSLRVTSVSAPSNGTAAISGGGVRYTPAANWHGMDSFTYVADDGNGGTAEASVEVTVAPVNDVPEAADDAATTLEDEPVTVAVLANDTDPDGDGLRVSSVTAPENGVAEVAAGGVRYTPAANWHGTDAFAYAVDDGNGGTASASVEVTVMPVNDAPAAMGTIPSQSLDEGGEPASIELSPFFSDTDGDALEYRASSSDPSVVEATVAGSVLTLVPAGYGTAEVTVTAADAGGLTATQTVAVGVSDRAARDVVSHAMAGLARSHLASVRMTLGRRTSASRTEASRLTLMGRKVPLGTGAARAEAERMWSGWLSGITSRAYSQAAPGAGAPMATTGLGMPGAGGAAMTSTGAPLGAGTPTAAVGATGTPMGAGASGVAIDGSGDGTSLGDLFRFGDLVPRFQGGRDPLRGSEFQFAFGGGQEAGGGGGGLRFQLWGQGDVQTFQGAPSGASDYDGELQTGYVGVDTWLSDNWMLGLAVARSRGTGDWRAGGASGSLETRLVAVHPYLQWSSGGTSLWATAGTGWGDADNVRDSGRTETSGLGLRLGLVELRRRLAAGGGFEFGLRADAGWAELASDAGAETLDGQTAAVNQFRFGADLSQQIRLGGLTLAPFGEAHVRRDGGAGQPGTGLELTGGLRAQAGFLRIDAQGRMLAVHSVAGYEERGLGLTLSLGNLGGEGLSLSMSPRWGDAIAGSDALWQEQIYSRDAPAASADGDPAVNAGDPAANTRDPWALDIRGNYGLRIPGGRLLNWSASLNHSTTGPRFTLGAQLGLGLGAGGTTGPEPSAALAPVMN